MTFALPWLARLIIRGLRLLRLVRALRMISYFKAAAWGAQGPGTQGVDGVDRPVGHDGEKVHMLDLLKLVNGIDRFFGFPLCWGTWLVVLW